MSTTASDKFVQTESDSVFNQRSFNLLVFSPSCTHIPPPFVCTDRLGPMNAVKLFTGTLAVSDTFYPRIVAPYHKRPPTSRPRSKLLSPRHDSRLHTKITVDNKNAANSKPGFRDHSAFMQDATCVEDESDLNVSDLGEEDSTFHWEEESTLFSELMNSG